MWQTDAWKPGQIGILQMASVERNSSCSHDHPAQPVVPGSAGRAADAICSRQGKGCPAALLTTDLSNWECPGQTLVSLLADRRLLVLCGLPVLAICFSMGGIHPEIAFDLSGLSRRGSWARPGSDAFRLSARKPEVLLVCYLVWIVFLLLLPIAARLDITTLHDWARFSNPPPPARHTWIPAGRRPRSGLFLLRLPRLEHIAYRLRHSQHSAKRVRARNEAGAQASSQCVAVLGRLHWIPGPSLDGNPGPLPSGIAATPRLDTCRLGNLHTVSMLFHLRILDQCAWSLGRRYCSFRPRSSFRSGCLVSITSVTSLQEELAKAAWTYC